MTSNKTNTQKFQVTQVPILCHTNSFSPLIKDNSIPVEVSTVALNSEKFVIVWEDWFVQTGSTDLTRKISAQIISNNGELIGTSFEVGSGSKIMSSHEIATTDMGFVIAWQGTIPTSPIEGDQIIAQHFDINGKPIGSMAYVLTPTEADNLSIYYVLDFALGARCGGEYIVAWIGNALSADSTDSTDSTDSIDSIDSIDYSVDSIDPIPTNPANKFKDGLFKQVLGGENYYIGTASIEGTPWVSAVTSGEVLMIFWWQYGDNYDEVFLQAHNHNNNDQVDFFLKKTQIVASGFNLNSIVGLGNGIFSIPWKEISLNSNFTITLFDSDGKKVKDLHESVFYDTSLIPLSCDTFMIKHTHPVDDIINGFERWKVLNFQGEEITRLDFPITRGVTNILPISAALMFNLVTYIGKNKLALISLPMAILNLTFSNFTVNILCLGLNTTGDECKTSVNKCALVGCSFIGYDNTLPYNYLILSIEAYDDQKDNQYLPAGRLPSDDYKIFKSSDSDGMPANLQTQGFFARAYYNKKELALIIAFRGTDGLHGDIFSDVEIFLANFFKNIVPNQWELAQSFINIVTADSCVELSPRPKYILFTGHSLGGALAELSAARYHYPAVVFDSPGAKKMVKNMIETHILSQEDLDYADSHCIGYASAPNLVNTAAQHLGIIKRVFTATNGVEFITTPQSTSVPDNIVRNMLLLSKFVLPASEFISIIFIQPSYYVYIAYYSFNQHAIVNILNQFNPETQKPKAEGSYKTWPGTITGYSGYDHYKARDTNPWYWDRYFEAQSPYFKFITYLKNIYNGLTLSYPDEDEGITIIGDDTGNKIWATTNFDDHITTGKGDDQHYLHGGNDISIDSGGNDVYIYPAENYGRNTIEDIGGEAKIIIGKTTLNGAIYPITKSECTQARISNTYLLPTHKRGKFYLQLQNKDLFIFDECGEIKNSILIKGFSGFSAVGRTKAVSPSLSFGLVLPTGTNSKFSTTDTTTMPTVLIGAPMGEALDCTAVENCIGVSLEGVQETLLVKLQQNATVYGAVMGQKIFEILNYIPSLKPTLNESFYNIDIRSVKEDDYIDISNITYPLTQENISQNGTDAFFTLGKTSVHISIDELTNFVHFALNDSKIYIKNIDMDPLYNGNFTSPENISLENITPTHSQSTSLTKSPEIFHKTVVKTAPRSTLSSYNPDIVNDLIKNNEDSSVNYGAIIGGSIGGVVGLFVLSGLAYIAYKYCYTPYGEYACEYGGGPGHGHLPGTPVEMDPYF